MYQCQREDEMEVNCDPHTIPNSEAEGSVSISEDQLTLPVYHVHTAIVFKPTWSWGLATQYIDWELLGGDLRWFDSGIYVYLCPRPMWKTQKFPVFPCKFPMASPLYWCKLNYSNQNHTNISEPSANWVLTCWSLSSEKSESLGSDPRPSKNVI